VDKTELYKKKTGQEGMNWFYQAQDSDGIKFSVRKKRGGGRKIPRIAD
jgi:hypothetical protein